VTWNKRSGARKRSHIARARTIHGAERAEKKFQVSDRPQEMHEASTGFQQMLERWPNA